VESNDRAPDGEKIMVLTRRSLEVEAPGPPESPLLIGASIWMRWSLASL
jgi:hypothetical protein